MLTAYFLIATFLSSAIPANGLHKRQLLTPKVRSLSGTRTTEGNNATNADVLKLITVGLLGGFAARKVKSYNDRIFLSRYRRSYWLGTRYFHLDNLYYLATRDTCIYHLNETERLGLEYEDGIPITDVVYQCQRYVDYCCGLDCCYDRKQTMQIREHRMCCPWDNPSSATFARPSFLIFFLQFFLSLLNLLKRIPYL